MTRNVPSRVRHRIASSLRGADDVGGSRVKSATTSYPRTVPSFMARKSRSVDIPVQRSGEVPALRGGSGWTIVRCGRRVGGDLLEPRYALRQHARASSASLSLGDHRLVPAPTVTGDASWIGTESLFSPDQKIGVGCVVGAGAVIREIVPNFSALQAFRPRPPAKLSDPTSRSSYPNSGGGTGR